MADLAERLEVVPRAVTTLVDALEAHGAVRRVPDPANRRVIRIELTDAGPPTLRALRSARRAAAEEILAPLDGRSARGADRAARHCWTRRRPPRAAPLKRARGRRRGYAGAGGGPLRTAVSPAAAATGRPAAAGALGSCRGRRAVARRRLGRRLDLARCRRCTVGGLRVSAVRHSGHSRIGAAAAFGKNRSCIRFIGRTTRK